ncbi:MAG: hypothetical protein HY028_01550 [Gammaproteobacteria bacterium]|nr:hypothetical protein [Gammaproteobacteria bacterium]
MNTSRISLSRCLLLVLLLGSMFPASAANLTILPANPKGQDTVYLQALAAEIGSVASSTVRVSMVANKIIVYYEVEVQFLGQAPLPLDVTLGRFPAGSYQVELRSGNANFFTVVGTRQFTVSDENINRPASFPLLDYTGLWWNTAESGWGLSITQMNDKLFAAWYVYDPAGRATWYTLQPGSWEIAETFTSSTSKFAYSGKVYKTTGPYWANPFNPSSVSTTQVGTGKLTFTSYNQAKFDYTIEGITGSKNIIRFEF